MAYTSYKVVEVPLVTDEELEKVINRWVGEGWVLDGIHFAMRESSRRPSMAFIVFASDKQSVENQHSS
jgi:hypothetical protein